MQKSEISIEEAWRKQEEFKKYLKKKEWDLNLKIKKNTLANINKLLNGRNDAIRFLDDFGSVILEAKRKVAEEKTERYKISIRISWRIYRWN